jgi:hypothetical protein
MRPLKKNIIISFCLLALCCSAHAQEVLMSQNVDTNNINHKKWGPNESHYIGFYAFYGAGVGNYDNRLPLAGGLNSIALGAGFYYKRKISGLLSIGVSLGYNYTYFRLKQTPGYGLTDSLFWHRDTEHKREKIYTNAASARGFLRINFDPHRGENLGRYLEVGGGPDWNFVKGYQTQDINADKIRVKTRFTHLPYISNFPEYAYARVTFNTIGIGLQYRLTNFFNSVYNLPEPPKYMLKVVIAR